VRGESRFGRAGNSGRKPRPVGERSAGVSSAVAPPVPSPSVAGYTPRHLADKILKSRSALEGERRQVTVLFGDVVGFTTLAEKLDPEEVQRIINRCFDGEPEIIAKIEHGMRRMGQLEAHIPYVRTLLGVDPGDPAVAMMEPLARRRKIFDAARALAQRGAALRPIVFVFEDLHWIDSTREDYPGYLMDSVARLAVMLIVTYRVGYTPPFRTRSFQTTLTLRSLSEEEGLAMARQVLGTSEFPEQIKAALMEKAEGVPLFVEEVAKTLLDVGLLRRENDGLRFVTGAADLQAGIQAGLGKGDEAGAAARLAAETMRVLRRTYDS
jgi:hypothetical protein